MTCFLYAITSSGQGSDSADIPFAVCANDEHTKESASRDGFLEGMPIPARS